MRKILAIIIGKFVSWGLLKFRGHTSFMGGKIALKIDPHLLDKLEKPKNIITVTGTNGKTSVTNILVDIVKESNLNYIDNRRGANLKTGLVNTLISNSTITGHTNADIGIFEVDERVSPLVYSNLKPDYLILTNLVRDSMKRNANTDYISYILEGSIPEKTKILVNGDDIIASSVTKNEKLFYGIDRIESDKETPFNIVRDIVVDEKTLKPLEYEFVRMNHQGRLDNTKNETTHSPELDYRLTNIDKEKNIISIYFKKENKIFDFNIIQETLFNIYNELAAIVGAYNLGIDIETIQKAVKNIKITGSRYEEYQLINNKKLIKNLAKGQNPIACSTVFKSVKDDLGIKKLILHLSDRFDNIEGSETVMWLYELDFEFLNDENIKEIYVIPPREKDINARLLLAGIDKSKINILNSYEEVANININDVEKIYILNDMYVEDEAQKMKQIILDKYKKI